MAIRNEFSKTCPDLSKFYCENVYYSHVFRQLYRKFDWFAKFPAITLQRYRVYQREHISLRVVVNQAHINANVEVQKMSLKIGGSS